MGALKICYVASEVAPLAKVGGLADVSAALPKALGVAGHDVRVFMPLYRDIKAAPADFEPVAAVQDVPVRLGARSYSFSLYTTPVGGDALTVHCVHCPDLYDRPGIYTSDADEAQRFLLLSRAAFEACQRLGWAPDVIHCNDWQTAVMPLLLRTTYSWDQLFAGTKTVLGIHNLGYQGVFASAQLPEMGLEDGLSLLDSDDLRAGRVNLLKVGLTYADALTTVSPTYAQEIQTPAFGAGLDALLRHRRADLRGILNGIDTDEWDPATDRFLPHRYTLESIGDKAKNKAHLLEELNLDGDPSAMLFGMVTRLTSQKGIELVQAAVPGFLGRRNARLVVVGTGEPDYERFLNELQEHFSDRVCFYQGYNNELSHLVEAASDAFIMPSQYEPCGLNQMYSLAYGTVPIVRRTGGLADSVVLYDPDTGDGTGFVFDHYLPSALEWALESAFDTFGRPEQWAQLVRNGMSQDFSWEKQMLDYAAVYNAVAGKPAVSAVG